MSFTPHSFHRGLEAHLSADDEQAVKEVERDAMWRLVIRSADVGDPPVGRDHQDGGHLVLQRAAEEGEALDVEHVHLARRERGRGGGGGREGWKGKTHGHMPSAHLGTL